MNVKKMYVISSDFYDSLIKKSKIVEDPIIAAQIKTEDEKAKILKSKNTEKAAALLSDISHTQAILEEQRKKKMAEPLPVTIAPIKTAETRKKRGRPPKVSYFEYENNQAGQGLLNRFYDYEPKRAKREFLNKCLRQSKI